MVETNCMQYEKSDFLYDDTKVGKDLKAQLPTSDRSDMFQRFQRIVTCTQPWDLPAVLERWGFTQPKSPSVTTVVRRDHSMKAVTATAAAAPAEAATPITGSTLTCVYSALGAAAMDTTSDSAFADKSVPTFSFAAAAAAVASFSLSVKSTAL